MEEPEVSLRERTRRAVRAEIGEAAMTLFLGRGFEATTVEDIARTAGISRRSYFRYFTSKEEAFAEALASLGRAIADELVRRPAEEPPWTALRGAFNPLLEQASTDPKAEALGRLMLERPALQQGKDAAWQGHISSALTHRLSSGGSEDDLLRAEALTAAAITCLHAAQAQWLAPAERRPLGALLDVTMDAVHPLE